MTYVERTDGLRVRLGPHCPPGHPDYGNPDIAIDERAQAKVIAHQQRILQRLDDWNLWQYFDEQGRMAQEYARLRKVEPEMIELVRLAKYSSDLKRAKNLPGQMEGQPQVIKDYPLPGPIHTGHRNVATAEWLIDKEMKAVFVFFHYNTKQNPFKKDHPDWEAMKGLHVSEKKQMAAKHDTVAWMGPRRKVHMAPQSGIAYTLLDDVKLPREMPSCKLIKYDHSDPWHNPALRGDRGHMQFSAYDNLKETVPPLPPEMVMRVEEKPAPEDTPEVKAKKKVRKNG